MTEKHLSSQFDSELNGVSSRVMELGGMVESQIHQAIYSLAQFDAETADRVMETEHKVNALEMEIDRELSSIIARRRQGSLVVRARTDACSCAFNCGARLAISLW